MSSNSIEGTRVRDVYITAAKRSAVIPRGGAFSDVALTDLSVPVVEGVMNRDTPDADALIMGNALYGGGNPARVIALAAGIDQGTPAVTIDTQCCAGLDAIIMAATGIKGGAYDHAIAGGAESFSRSAIRMHRPFNKGAEPVPYDRPPFTPWTDRDPDMIEAAANLAFTRKITRIDQEHLAIDSHQKAMVAANAEAFTDEIVRVKDRTYDSFTRVLSTRTCGRLPVLAGRPPYELTNATTAVEADAAAFVLISSTRCTDEPAVRFVDGLSQGDDPTSPGLAPIAAFEELLKRNDIAPSDLQRVELMEAFAAQALAFVEVFEIDPEVFNVKGGALARGHPIGASGAVLAVRLYHEMLECEPGALGVAAIAGAGGLASVLLFERV